MGRVCGCDDPATRVAKALDKIESLLQHPRGVTSPGFDYRFNPGNGRDQTVPVAETAALADSEDGSH